MSRRNFLGASLALAFAPPTVAGCGGASVFGTTGSSRLTARPAEPTLEPTLGATALGLGGARDGLLYVPTTYSSATPSPLFVMLHGAGGSASNLEDLFPIVEELGIVALIPESRGRSWDILTGGFGPDVAFIDQALQHTFERCRVHDGRLALGGFSDGASYSLSLGAGNGDLFTHIMAYSPGFFSPLELVGTPGFFVSHGTTDGILPFEITRDRIVPQLMSAGFEVRFEEFNGGHTLTRAMIDLSFEWFRA